MLWSEVRGALKQSGIVLGGQVFTETRAVVILKPSQEEFKQCVMASWENLEMIQKIHKILLEIKISFG